jgi:putative hydrolase of the HAD superfamily
MNAFGRRERFRSSRSCATVKGFENNPIQTMSSAVVPRGEGFEIRAVLLDYGGVIAEEGFVEGLAAIATAHGLPVQRVREAAVETIHSSGYIVGRAAESDFWRAFRRATGVQSDDASLRAEILERFRLRPRMLELVRALRGRGLRVAILSDQTDWLDRLESRDRFFCEFDAVYNSYHLGKTKRDPSLFADVRRDLGVPPVQILFVDDKREHVERARSEGLRGLVSEGVEPLLAELDEILGLSPEVARATQSG